MVEQRRQINYELSIRKTEVNEEESAPEGKRIRSPKCARCSAHGKKQALRGHKKILCPFNKCTCDLVSVFVYHRSYHNCFSSVRLGRESSYVDG